MNMSMADRWYYNGEHRNAYTTELAIGDIIVGTRKPYRLLGIWPRPHVNWNDRYLTAWETSGRPDPETWRHRPFALRIISEFGTEPQDYDCEVTASARWTVLPEHFAICRLCGELPPCTETHNNHIVEREAARFADAMQILPGACHHCKELITRRQGSIRFEGANLIRPDLGENSALFHTRSKCWNAAFDYDKRWAAAEPGRRGKLSCPGNVTRHADGTAECLLGENCAGEKDALGEWMRHAGLETRHYPAWVGRDGQTRPGTDCWCTTAATIAGEVAR